MAMAHLCRGILLRSMSVFVRTLKRFLQSPHQYGIGLRDSIGLMRSQPPQRGQYIPDSPQRSFSNQASAAVFVGEELEEVNQ